MVNIFELETTECDIDIVSEWTEPIDEKELDKLAKEYAQKELGYSDIQMQDFDSWSTVAQAKFREVCEDFKAGYRKAKEKI